MAFLHYTYIHTYNNFGLRALRAYTIQIVMKTYRNISIKKYIETYVQQCSDML